jgi:predicted nicotinamide N-methyase
VLYSHPLSYRDRVVGELFENAIVASVVCFRQVASSNIAAKSEGVKLTLDGGRSNDESSQRRLAGQLTKHQREQLVPAGEVLDILVTVILFDDAKEDKLIQKLDHLSENV